MAGTNEGKTGISREGIVKVLLSLVVIVLIAARSPELLSQPRFWAEEGSLYFAYAYNHSFIANFFAAHLGYYTLYSNLAAFVATLVPLESAPLVTTWLSFCVQAGASLLVIWGTYRTLPHLSQKFAVAVSIQLLSYAGSWLNIAGVQYFFGIITFLILMHDEQAASAIEKRLHGVLLLISGLTGVISCFLLPVFIYKYFRKKFRHLAVYSGIMLFSLCIQVVVFIRAVLNSDPEIGVRLVGNDPIRLALKTISFQFATPFFGHLLLTTPAMEDLGYELRKAIHAVSNFDNFRTDSQVVTTIAGLIILCILATLFYRMRHVQDTRYMLLLFAVVTPVSIIFSVQMSGGPRYTYLSSVMFFFFITSLVKDMTLFRVTRAVAGVLMLLSVLSSSYEYRRSIAETAYNKSWLPWKDEVRKWRQYPVYDPGIWPPPWRMKLDK